MNNKLTDKFNNVLFNIIPIILFFSYFLSIIGIKLTILISINFLIILIYIIFISKIYFNKIVILFFLFMIWASILYFINDSIESIIKTNTFFCIVAAALMMLSIYYYSLLEGIKNFNYYIYLFIILSFIIAFLEINYSLILPSSGKYIDEEYARRFFKVPTSIFYNPNDFATVIGILFIYTYSYCLFLKRKIRYIILLFCLYIILFTGSRGVQLIVLLFPLLYSIMKGKSIFKIIILYILIIIILYIFIKLNQIPYVFKKYLDTFNALNSGQIDNSSLLRLEIIIYTLKNLNKLIIGYGPGGSSLFLNNFSIINPHNFFIEILIDYGFIGLFLSVTIFIMSFKKNLYILRNTDNIEIIASCKATIILMFFFILFSVVPSSLFLYWPFAWFPIYLTMINLGNYKKLLNN